MVQMRYHPMNASCPLLRPAYSYESMRKIYSNWKKLLTNNCKCTPENPDLNTWSAWLRRWSLVMAFFCLRSKILIEALPENTENIIILTTFFVEHSLSRGVTLFTKYAHLSIHYQSLLSNDVFQFYVFYFFVSRHRPDALAGQHPFFSRIQNTLEFQLFCVVKFQFNCNDNYCVFD